MAERGGVLDGGGRMVNPELERKLQIESGQSVAVVNVASCEPALIPLTGALDPDQADIVVGFTARRADLKLLTSVYDAARAGRLAWVGYPKPNRLGTDVNREWLVRAVRQYGVTAVRHVSIDYLWSALLLQPLEND